MYFIQNLSNCLPPGGFPFELMATNKTVVLFYTPNTFLNHLVLPSIEDKCCPYNVSLILGPKHFHLRKGHHTDANKTLSTRLLFVLNVDTRYVLLLLLISLRAHCSILHTYICWRQTYFSYIKA